MVFVLMIIVCEIVTSQFYMSGFICIQQTLKTFFTIQRLRYILRFDTMRHDVFTCAQKATKSQFNLARAKS